MLTESNELAEQAFKEYCEFHEDTIIETELRPLALEYFTAGFRIGARSMAESALAKLSVKGEA